MTHTPYKVILILLFIAFSMSAILYSNQELGKYRKDKISKLERCPEPKGQSSGNEDYQVILIGDSRIWEWSQYWPSEFPTAINRGFPGATTMEITCRNADLKYVQDKLFIIHAGINDAVSISMLNNETERHSQTLKSAKITAEFANMLSVKNTVIFLNLVPPIDTDPIRRLVWGNDIDHVAEDISKKITDELDPRIAILDARSLFYNDKNKAWDTELSRDALHWNRKGYELLNQELSSLSLVQ